ncbi:MAG: 50S ribosomal protein L13 [Patescibacteria group bacterium]|jgi:large subunit ribosomal protein L13
MKTTILSNDKVEIRWTFVDASNKVLGKLAADVSAKLIGKHRVEYAANQNYGDKVVVTNAAKIAVTGNKMKEKLYIHHTGFPKGLRTRTLEELMKKDPTEALRLAIKGMLPKNKLSKERLANLYIYAGSEHPHKAQEK